MTTTTRKIRPMNLLDFQARQLQTNKRLLVVEPLKNQPPEHLGTIHFGEYSPRVVNRRSGIEQPGARVYGAYSDDGEWSIKSPYQPGDVVPCREKWAFGICETGDANGFCYELDGLSSLARKWYPANSMPERAIRLHPVCVSVECRRVSRIDELEALDAAFEGSVIVGTMKESGKPPRTQEWINGSAEEAFRDDWHRRHKRPCDAFDVAWGWFNYLRLEK